MIGPMIYAMLAAADAEEMAKLRQRFFPDVEGEITPEHVRAAIPEIAVELFFKFREAELPGDDDLRAAFDEHGEDEGSRILRDRFLGWVRARVGGTA